MGTWEEVKAADADPNSPVLTSDVVYNGLPDHITKGMFYIPVTAVFDFDRLTTKTRLCFDLSQKNKQGISLNSIIHTGPKFFQIYVRNLRNFFCFVFVFFECHKGRP